MRHGYVRYVRGDAETVKEHLDEYTQELEYLIQERVEEVRFVRWDGQLPGPPWPRGRAFGTQVEVRWRQVAPDTFDVLVLTETEQLGPEWICFETREPHGQESLRHYLWGTHRAELGGWVEAQLPRPLRYPLDSPQSFAYVEAIEYSRDGVVQLTRFRALRGEERHDR